MKLLEVIQACHGRVSGGDPYLWQCYGNNAQFMEFRDADGQGYAHCIFDTNTYDVYEVHAEIPGKDYAYRWLEPRYEHAMISEAKDRGIDHTVAWDGVKYIDFTPNDKETVLDFLDKIGNLNYIMIKENK